MAKGKNPRTSAGFRERAEGLKELLDVEYCCFMAVFDEPVSDQIKVKHVVGKIDELVKRGNYGYPRQFLEGFKDLCDYLSGRDVKFKIKFRYTVKNSLVFNLHCLVLLITNKPKLYDYKAVI